MNAIITTTKRIGVLTIALTLALAANFVYGQWVDPSAAPTAGNVSLPINTSSEGQTKYGNLGITGNFTAYDTTLLNRLTTVYLTTAEATAATMFKSPNYCDFNGDNCWTPGSLPSLLPNCSSGQVLMSNGSSWTCATLPAEPEPAPTPAPIPTPPMLANGLRSHTDCTDAGGAVTDIGGANICRFASSLCPDPFVQYESWRSLVQKTCRGAYNGCSGNTSCTLSATFSNQSASCTYRVNERSGDGCQNSINTMTCTSPVTQVGCY